MPQYERELSEEEIKRQKEMWNEWLKKKPQQKQPSDFLNEMFNSEIKTGGER